MSSDSVSIETVVAVDPDTAFEIFTQDIDTWWRRGPRFRGARSASATLRFEEGVGRRLLEGSGDEAFELGRVSIWEPGKRLAFDLGGRDFGREHPRSQVDIRFEATEAGTRIRLTNFGFDAMAEDHPIRHGQLGAALTQMMGVWWAELLSSLRAHAKSERN